MSIRDDVATYLAVRGPACRVGIFLATLDVSVRDELETALKDRALASTAFQRWALDRHGERVGDQSWTRHRNGECSCGRR